MKISKTYYAANRSEWRRWLQKHHATEKEIWLVYYKKHSRKPRVAYNDAVEEALCFGWIDSVIQKIDDKKYAQKFTPRNPKSKWSALNKQRAAKLIQEGKMTNAGLAKCTYTNTKDDYGRTPKRKTANLHVPPFLKKALVNKPKAWTNFKQLAPSYRRNYIGWVSSAKTQETRNKRLKEAMFLLASNKKLGLK